MVKQRSELKGEVADILGRIQTRRRELVGELGRLDDLESRAEMLFERLCAGPGDRGTVEEVGALLDSVGWDG